MNIENPAWLILLPVLALVAWFWRGLALWRPLRAAAILLVGALLARPRCGCRATQSSFCQSEEAIV